MCSSWPDLPPPTALVQSPNPRMAALPPSRHALITLDSTGIATLTLTDASPLNIIGMPAIAELRAARLLLSQRPELRVLVLRGSGDKAFIGGADIGEMVGLTPASSWLARRCAGPPTARPIPPTERARHKRMVLRPGVRGRLHSRPLSRTSGTAVGATLCALRRGAGGAAQSRRRPRRSGAGARGLPACDPATGGPRLPEQAVA